MHISRLRLRLVTRRLFPVLLLALAAAACSRSETPEAARQPPPPDQGADGAITAGDAWVREMPPGSRVAGGYLVLDNGGDTDDRLLAVESDQAARVEIHEMRHEDGMMRMRHLPDGLALPAGERTVLEPGGYHLMLIEPVRQFAAGEAVEATLRFEGAPELALTFEVRGTTPSPHGDHTE